MREKVDQIMKGEEEKKCTFVVTIIVLLHEWLHHHQSSMNLWNIKFVNESVLTKKGLWICDIFRISFCCDGMCVENKRMKRIPFVKEKIKLMDSGITMLKTLILNTCFYWRFKTFIESSVINSPGNKIQFSLLVYY